MGIRNCAERPGNHRDLRLITPHGDSEHGGCCSDPQCYNSHNPSWGFGTRDAPAPKAALDRLITPHGDSEQPTRPQMH